MKYFQHESNARNDIKIKMLQKAFGNDGYATYFKMLEIISEYATERNIDEWGFVDRFHKTDTLADECGVSPDLLKKILLKCNELDLFEQKEHRLYCAKILKRLDNYSAKVIRKYKKDGGEEKSEKNPEKQEIEAKNGVRTKSVQSTARIDLKEEKREESLLPKDKSCTHSLDPCDEYCTWDIGNELDTHKNNVDEIKDELIAYLKAGNKKKYKIFHDTLIAWVRRGLKSGDISHMEEIEKMDMEGEHPDYKKKQREIAKILVQKGVL